MTKLRHKQREEETHSLHLSADAVHVSVGGALFFVCSVVVTITAHDDDTALLILF